MTHMEAFADVLHIYKTRVRIVYGFQHVVFWFPRTKTRHVFVAYVKAFTYVCVFKSVVFWFSRARGCGGVC